MLNKHTAIAICHNVTLEFQGTTSTTSLTEDPPWDQPLDPAWDSAWDPQGDPPRDPPGDPPRDPP